MEYDRLLRGTTHDVTGFDVLRAAAAGLYARAVHTRPGDGPTRDVVEVVATPGTVPARAEVEYESHSRPEGDRVSVTMRDAGTDLAASAPAERWQVRQTADDGNLLTELVLLPPDGEGDPLTTLSTHGPAVVAGSGGTKRVRARGDGHIDGYLVAPALDGGPGESRG